MHRTVSKAAFSAQGNLFAYASSYDWSQGSGGYAPGVQGQNEIWVHYVLDDEIKPKGKSRR